MSGFPFFMEIGGKTGLIVGGGEVARRKAEKLLDFGAELIVVAPEILDDLKNREQVTALERPFREEDLDCKPAFVVTATDEPAVNRKVAEACQARNILVNVADDEGACGFVFPALVKKGDMIVGISTDGASPTAARVYRQRIEASLPKQTPELMDYLRRNRADIKAAYPKGKLRTKLIRGIAEAALKKGAPLETDEEQQLVNALKAENIALGKVSLVGAGCGSADLITVRGMRLLQNCDAVVYDELIDRELLDLVPPHAERISMGKRAGQPSAQQEEIIRVLIEQARLGRNVVRLKGGDPYLFGRGGEELYALQEAGIPCQEVPGVPSAIGIPAQYDIPVTHRKVSRSLHIVTAHTADTADGLPADMPLYAKMEGTLVFLMGLGKLEAICAALIREGKCADTPAAVLSGGNAPHPVCIRGTLATLPALAADAVAPAIIVVGDVTALGAKN